MSTEYDPESIESKAAVIILIIGFCSYPVCFIATIVYGLIKIWPTIEQFFVRLG